METNFSLNYHQISFLSVPLVPGFSVKLCGASRDTTLRDISEGSTKNRAASWQNLFLPYSNNKDADQPAHQRSLISAFVVRCLDSILPLLSISELSSLNIASVPAQAGLSLTWTKTLKTGFLVTRLNSSFQWCITRRYLWKKVNTVFTP